MREWDSSEELAVFDDMGVGWDSSGEMAVFDDIGVGWDSSGELAVFAIKKGPTIFIPELIQFSPLHPG